MENRMRICGFIVAVIVMVVLITVYGSSISNSTSVAAASVPFTKLAQGTQSTVSERTNYLITSTSELEQLWKMIGAKGSPPTIDFNKNSVAAIFAGTVSRVEDTDVRTVTVIEKSCPLKDSTTPYELIALPTTLLNFTHEDQATNNCL